MNVFLTFDVEVWCNGWDHLDRDFPQAFERYAYGRSRHGDFALPKTLEILRSHGIRATFFVESLFAYRFGIEPLTEIVGMIQEANQDVQLHVHPEWADETRPPLVDGGHGKRPLLAQYTLRDQIELIGKAKEMLVRAGAPVPCAFRAGSYGCNRDTLVAAARNGIKFDSSINAGQSWSGADLTFDERGQRVRSLEGVIEYPLTVYQDRPGRRRQAQVGSTSFGEFTRLLRQGCAQRRNAFVIISHNFEMLVQGKSEPDAIVARRFSRLCQFLAEYPEDFNPITFAEADDQVEPCEPPVLTSPPWSVAWRTMEQVWRRTY